MNAPRPIRRERGMALLIALVVLIVVSILGATAMRSALMQSKISVNGQINNMMFEGAESGLRSIEWFAQSQINTGTALTNTNHIFYKAVSDGIAQQVCIDSDGSLSQPATAVTLTPSGDDWNITYTDCPQRAGSPIIITAVAARAPASAASRDRQGNMLCGNAGATICDTLVYTQSFASISGLNDNPHSHVQILGFQTAAGGGGS